MQFTDIFIRRPVLASVVSLMILVLGLRAIFGMPVLQYPRTENAIVTVSTVYYGADPDVIAGFITTPMENAVSQVNGIDYMTSTSQNSVSTIKAYLRLNYDPNKALTEINTKISSVLNQLPPQAQQPSINIEIGQTVASMYIGFSSDKMEANSITDYLIRVVQPRVQAVEGVQLAELIGNKNFALRAWLDPQKLAAYNLTAADVSAALARNNYISGIGNTKGQMVQVNLTASTSVHSLEEFKSLAIKQDKGAIVRLQDVANVTLGSEDYETEVSFDGQKAIYIGIKVAPSANLLDVIGRVRAIFPDMKKQLPEGLTSEIVYDATKFVNSSIDEVIRTLFEALVIVAFVVFAFLGSPRSVFIPLIAIPLSLIGAFVVMLMLGFSINLLTLLALVLAIGLVVDDAIIVVENVNRHLEEGMAPTDAAILAARELLGPIIAMTIVLIAVYIPLGFQDGLTGALFTEFAFTLVGAVTISAVVALTLSPVLCAKMLQPHHEAQTTWEGRMVARIDRYFQKLQGSYHRLLHNSLNYRLVTYVFSILVFLSIFGLIMTAKTELAPQEDLGIVAGIAYAQPNSTLEQRQIFSREVYKSVTSFPETEHVFQLDVPGVNMVGAVFSPWDERTRTSNQLQPLFQMAFNKIAGFNMVAFQFAPLPGSDGLPVQFVIKTTQGFDQLGEVSDEFMQQAMKEGIFMFLDSDLKIDLPQARVEIDRDKTTQLGLSMDDVGNAMASMLGGGYVNYFSLYGRSYKVIPQVQQRSRLNIGQLDDYFIRTAEGNAIPLSTVAKIETRTIPRSLNHFQQQNAAIISGVTFVPLGDALKKLDDLAKRILPQGYTVDYAGQSRQLIQESSAFIWTFLFATIIIYLTLAAQFESFWDPVIILVSVPMSIAGAMIFISLGVGEASINIYTKVGIVTLMGLVSKHGILMVEFANRLQEEGASKRDAIEQACGIRLRPILMTTAAMVLGVLPLILASGAGAVSRFNMGLVISTGLTIGTLFTLFVVPAFYMLLGADHHKHNAQPPAAH